MFGAGPWFKSTDCTESPFIKDDQGVFPSVAINVPGNTVYVRDPNGPLQTVTVGSVLLGNVNNHGTCAQTSFSAQMYPAVPLIDLDILFTAPFTVTKCRPGSKGKVFH